jgi:hypothetical protein
VVKSIVEILLNPELPPQTGSFFHNPLEEDKGDILDKKDKGDKGEERTSPTQELL